VDSKNSTNRFGDYSKKGEYHRNIDINWIYYPIYRAKINYLKKIFKSFRKNSRVLDIGCGEGVFVDYLIKEGFDASGLDLNYSSDTVTLGNIKSTNFKNNYFDIILILDVLEHMNILEQEMALLETRRILKPNGVAIISVPNLAHFSSRLSFLITGKLLRTSTITRHPGDRPFAEFKEMISRFFIIEKIKGLFPTFPVTLYLTTKKPSLMVGWHDYLNSINFPVGWCFLNIFICYKRNTFE